MGGLISKRTLYTLIPPGGSEKSGTWNPTDLCFDRKRPYFEWLVVQNRGHDQETRQFSASSSTATPRTKVVLQVLGM